MLLTDLACLGDALRGGRASEEDRSEDHAEHIALDALVAGALGVLDRTEQRLALIQSHIAPAHSMRATANHARERPSSSPTRSSTSIARRESASYSSELKSVTSIAWKRELDSGANQEILALEGFGSS